MYVCSEKAIKFLVLVGKSGINSESAQNSADTFMEKYTDIGK